MKQHFSAGDTLCLDESSRGEVGATALLRIQARFIRRDESSRKLRAADQHVHRFNIPHFTTMHHRQLAFVLNVVAICQVLIVCPITIAAQATRH